MSINKLSFMRAADTQGGAYSFWSPADTADWADGNRLGREYAAELLAFISAGGAPSLLGQVCCAISASGVYGGVEVGFFHAIAVAAIS